MLNRHKIKKKRILQKSGQILDRNYVVFAPNLCQNRVHGYILYKFIFLKQSMSNYLNGRQMYLDVDYLESISPLPTYDSDLENFWSQKSKLLHLKLGLEIHRGFLPRVKKSYPGKSSPGKKNIFTGDFLPGEKNI